MTAIEHHAGALIVLVERLAHENEILTRTTRQAERRLMALVEDLRVAEREVRVLRLQVEALEGQPMAANERAA